MSLSLSAPVSVFVVPPAKDEVTISWPEAPWVPPAAAEFHDFLSFSLTPSPGARVSPACCCLRLFLSFALSAALGLLPLPRVGASLHRPLGGCPISLSPFLLGGKRLQSPCPVLAMPLSRLLPPDGRASQTSSDALTC